MAHRARVDGSGTKVTSDSCSDVSPDESLSISQELSDSAVVADGRSDIVKQPDNEVSSVSIQLPTELNPPILRTQPESNDDCARAEIVVSAAMATSRAIRFLIIPV